MFIEYAVSACVQALTSFLVCVTLLGLVLAQAIFCLGTETINPLGLKGPQTKLTLAQFHNCSYIGSTIFADEEDGLDGLGLSQWDKAMMKVSSMRHTTQRREILGRPPPKVESSPERSPESSEAKKSEQRSLGGNAGGEDEPDEGWC